MANGSALSPPQPGGYTSMNWGPLANLGIATPQQAPLGQLGQYYGQNNWQGAGAADPKFQSWFSQMLMPQQTPMGDGMSGPAPGGNIFPAGLAWPQQQQQQQPPPPSNPYSNVPAGETLTSVSSATSPGPGWTQNPNNPNDWTQITPPPDQPQPQNNQQPNGFKIAGLPWGGGGPIWGGGGPIGTPGTNPYTLAPTGITGQPAGGLSAPGNPVIAGMPPKTNYF